ncbi:MAG: hypothetical protein HGB06_06340 [Chlorobaculum sp.]|jgi:predicted ATPase|nr:hypothetical protein [Chlorobaculum sp.]
MDRQTLLAHSQHRESEPQPYTVILTEAEAPNDAIRAVYESLGYELIEVPKLPVDARCEFVLGKL